MDRNPSSWFSKPAIIFKSVVLPVPFCPTKASFSPLQTVKLNPLNKGLKPKFLCILFASTIIIIQPLIYFVHFKLFISCLIYYEKRKIKNQRIANKV